MLNVGLPLVVKAKTASKERDIKPSKWWINRHTPLGEDADIYECKPFGGNKYIPRKDILGNRAKDGSIINKPR